MDAEVAKYLSELNLKIRRGCTTHITRTGRLYYMNHETKTSSWLPPVESWESGASGLPYGWEAAFDRDGKTYFINHVNKTTTSEDPRKDSDEEPPQPRQVELLRDPHKGFGFVAGSERPVIVRFVTEGGPSEGLLLPGDQILQINDEDVAKSPRERVIELVRSCKHSVQLQVCQPITNNTTRKSALLTAAKKAKLKSNPSRVRFAEGVVINGSPLYCPSPFDSQVPFMPNVLKVFLENGQTKSFKYDGATTVQDVLSVLQEKLSISASEHFSLVVEHIRSVRRHKLSILNPKDTLAKIAARPGAHHLRCLFRLTFVPRDVYELMQRDLVAFDYLFVQCSNDVVKERLAPELKYDVALRLAALHVQEHAAACALQAKAIVKAVEREYGLERFVPPSLMDTMKRKELVKLLGQLVKQHQALGGHNKPLTAAQSRFHYLKIVSDLPGFGARTFATCCKNSGMETAILVGPRIGISQISTIRNIAPINLCQFSELESIEVVREDDFSYKVRIRLRHPEKESLSVVLEERETEELVLVLERYHSLLVGAELPVEWEGRDPEPVERVPSYHGRHVVQDSPWSFCPAAEPAVRTVDFSMPPPPYVPCEERRLSRSNSRDQFSLATSPSSVDHNMNETLALANFAKPPAKTSPTLNGRATDTVDLPSVLSTELLEEEEAVEEEGRDAVARRVAEMGQIVTSAQLYLQGVTSSCDDDSEADTTPAESPTHAPPPTSEEADKEAEQEEAKASFGLHSTSAEVEELLRQLRDSTSLESGSLCLDPDLIDLTIVPGPDDVDFGCVTPDSGDRLALLDRETGQPCPNGDPFRPITACEETEDPPPPREEEPPPNDEVMGDDLSAYIIPPPPSLSTRVVEEQNRLLARFRQAAEEVRRVVAHDPMASVSRFCTMPRRHDAVSVAPQPPPRVKRLGSAAEGAGRRPQHDQGAEGADPPAGFSRTLSLDSFKGAGHAKEQQTSQNDSIPHQTANPDLPLTNGHHELTNGYCGDDDVRLNGDVSPDPCEDACATCANKNGMATRGCVCKKLDRFLSYHQSLPRKSLHAKFALKPDAADEAFDSAMQDTLINLDAASRMTLRKSEFGAPLTADDVTLTALSLHSRLTLRHANGDAKQDTIANLDLACPTLLRDCERELSQLPARKGSSKLASLSDAENEPFDSAQQEIAAMILRLDSACKARLQECEGGPSPSDNGSQLANARDTLLSESRRFVTASKLFVKSITESSDKMAEHLSECVALLGRIFEAGEQVARATRRPEHVRALADRLAEAATAYARTVRAARSAAAGEIPNANMAGLMHQATALATSLTTLMRTLRTFSAP